MPIPFMGETMKCIMSGEVKQSDPNVESNWYCIIIDGKRFYVSDTWREKSYKQYGVKMTWVKIYTKLISLY